MEKSSNTFRPSLCTGTQDLIEETAYANKPFLDRQREFVDKVEGKKQERELEEAETFRGYFKPK